MADNLEVRVEQLTSAIRGLYDKPTATVGDINNAINSVMQRLDNSNDANSEQLGQTLVNDIRRIMEEKHNYLQEHLSGFESALRQIASGSNDQKLNGEISRLTAEVSTVYTKMSNQETLLNNIARSIDNSSGSVEEIERLRNEIASFSRGFENITQTLNKNFNDFLIQVQGYSGKEDFKRLFVDIDSITNNTNAIISALAIIDHKYKDLTGLIDMVTKKENVFSQGLEELSRSIKNLEEFSALIRNAGSKDDLNYLNEKISNLKTHIEAADADTRAKMSELIYGVESKINALQNNSDLDRLKEEMRSSYAELKENSRSIKDELQTQVKSAATSISSTLKEDFTLQSTSLNTNLQTLSSEILKLQEYLARNVDTKTDEIRSEIKSFISDFSQLRVSLESSTQAESLRENLERINDENFIKMYDLIHEQLVNLDSSIELRTASNKLEISGAISSLQGDVKSVVTSLMNLKNDLGDVSRQNLHILREPIEKALSNIENLTIGNELKQLQAAIDGIMTDIRKSFEALKDNFSEIATSSNIEVLQQLNSSIPSIADRLEIFRTHVISENSANLQELRQHFNEAMEAVKANVESVTTTLKADFANINDEISETIKIDMQKLSDHIVESVEGVNLSISQEFNDHKVNIDELLVRIQDYENRFKDKLDSIEATFESLNQETCERMTDAINTNNKQYQDAINSVKKDIVTHVSGMGEQSRSAIAEVSLKVDQLLEAQSVGALTSVGPDEKSVAYANLETKLERSNLQQIHNAKELMEEIQNLNTEISFKIENMLEADDSGNVSKFMAKLEDKIQSLLDNGRDIDELAKTTKDHIDNRMKEILQKISKSNAIQSVKADKKSDASVDDEISSNSKVQELVSGLEFLQKNIFEEMKESFEKQNEILNDIADTKVPEVDTDELAKKIKDYIDLNELVDKIKNAADADEIAKRVKETVDDSIKKIKEPLNVDELAIKIKDSLDIEEFLKRASEPVDADEMVSKIKEQLDVDDIVRRLRETVASVENKVSNTLENKVNGVEKQIQELGEAISRLQKSTPENTYTYTMEDIESDLAKMRLSFEKSNSKVSDSVDAQKNALDDVRGKLTTLQKAALISGGDDKVEDIAYQISKKLNMQEARFNDVEDKLGAIIQKQNEEFDIKAFIDVFYENTTQTKSLASRVETMESQLSVIARHMQKIISYIEE